MFVLLVYWVHQADLELLYKVQMERWDRTVLYINATCVDLGPKRLQLLGISGCDTTSYPYIRQREDQCAKLKYPACSRLFHVLGEVDTYHTHRSGRGNKVCALYGQLSGTSMGSACSKLFTKSDGPTSNIRKPVAACSAGLCC